MKQLYGQRGVTLIEVFISMIIFAVGLLGIMQFSLQMWYHTNFIKQQTEALAICQQQMEQLRSYEVIPITQGWSAYSGILSNAIGQTTNGSNATYTTTWIVNTVSSPAYKIVDVTTSWTDTRGNSQSVMLSSIIAQIDPVSEGTLMS